MNKIKKQIEHYPNGQIKKEETYKDGKRDGEWTYWYENEQKQWEGTFKDGELDLYTEYFESWEELLKWAGSDDDDNSTGEPDSQNETDSKE
jgi:antitoxin component YwqK of YwqJK toxin-antitoxin module